MVIRLTNPDLQVNFAAALIQLRETLLQDALFQTMKKLRVTQIDKELAVFANAADLAFLASKGLRGEVAFATPQILKANPRLLGYYRLLQGFSQKAFYASGTGIGLFKMMEERGLLSPAAGKMLPELCRALNASASYLVNSVSDAALTASFLDDLTLLTLGPQLRGGVNVKKGAQGIVLVFESLKALVEPFIVATSPRVIKVKNAAGRTVLIEFAPDPDIIIREQISADGDTFRNIIAIEVKGGTDFSNIHNRIGEAEKSHQKAKLSGYTECWTVVNVDRVDLKISKRESPSTNRFYLLSQIQSGIGNEFRDFKNRIEALTGIPTPKITVGGKKRSARPFTTKL